MTIPEEPTSGGAGGVFPWLLRPIRGSDDEAVAAIIRSVMTEHGASGPGFAIHDAEVQAMTAHYPNAGARYYVVEHRGVVHGGAGFAPLEGAKDSGTCELRKMYFLPAARGLGLGRAMLDLLLAEMRTAGYRRCYLETTAKMPAAQRLYRAAGFVQRCSSEGATGHHGCDTFFARDL